MRSQRGQFYSKKKVQMQHIGSQIFYFRQLVLFKSNFGMFT